MAGPIIFANRPIKTGEAWERQAYSIWGQDHRANDGFNHCVTKPKRKGQSNAVLLPGKDIRSSLQKNDQSHAEKENEKWPLLVSRSPRVDNPNKPSKAVRHPNFQADNAPPTNPEPKVEPLRNTTLSTFFSWRNKTSAVYHNQECSLSRITLLQDM